jgi:SAM-dependent methyltransferase
MDERTLPESYFERIDPTSDALFYSMPRLVTHIDDTTIDALTDFYREGLPAGGVLLDLMSSWVSHLPAEVSYRRVALLGMNAEELRQNPRADDWLVHDLNVDPNLPYAEASFDAVLNAVSVQYITRPAEVFASVCRVLKPGGLSVVAMSHRCFPTKAIRAFHGSSGEMRMSLVMRYHELAGGFSSIEGIDRSPAGADPLWIVIARRAD